MKEYTKPRTEIIPVLPQTQTLVIAASGIEQKEAQ